MNRLFCIIVAGKASMGDCLHAFAAALNSGRKCGGKTTGRALTAGTASTVWSTTITSTNLTP